MRKFLPLLALLVMSTACGNFIGIGDSIAGTYTLVSVGGAPVPVTLVSDVTGRVTVTAGSVKLHANHTFSRSITSEVVTWNISRTETDQLVGTYVKNNDALVFNYSDGTQDAGAVSGREITITAGGYVFRFRR